MQAEKRQQEQLEQRHSSRELSQELPSLPAAAQAPPPQQAPPPAKVIWHTAHHGSKEGRTSSRNPPVAHQSAGRMHNVVLLSVPDAPAPQNADAASTWIHTPPNADAVPTTRVHFPQEVSCCTHDPLCTSLEMHLSRKVSVQGTSAGIASPPPVLSCSIGHHATCKRA